MHYFKTSSRTKEKFIIASPIDIDTNEVSVDPNETMPTHIILSPQGIGDHSILSRNSRSSISKSKSPMIMTPEKECPGNITAANWVLTYKNSSSIDKNSKMENKCRCEVSEPEETENFHCDKYIEHIKEKGS